MNNKIFADVVNLYVLARADQAAFKYEICDHGCEPSWNSRANSPEPGEYFVLRDLTSAAIVG